MFTDKRSKKIVFIAHCLLNQNAISDGTAVYPAAFKDVITALLDADVGIVQMPCPELCCLGLDRQDAYGAQRPVVEENTRIRRELEKPGRYEHLQEIVETVAGQIREYRKYDFAILGIIGANRSPSCGIETTSDQDKEIEGMGLFMEMLDKRLREEHMQVPMIGLKASEPVKEKIKSLLAGI